MEIRMTKICTLSFVIIIFLLLSITLNGQEIQNKKKYYALFLKTSKSWKMINKELTITRDFYSNDPQFLPGNYFHSIFMKTEERNPGPVLFHVDFSSDGSLIFYLETVSDTGIFQISLDGEELMTFTFLTGPAGTGPWIESRYLRQYGIYQCDYNKEYSVKIPAGKHDILLQNIGTDWLRIGYFVFTEYSEKILTPEYEDWKIYEKTLDKIEQRLANYKERAHKVISIKEGDINYDLIPTLKLQMENLGRLAKNHPPVDFNLIRTENELKEILNYMESGKDYFKSKLGRKKIGYLSEIDSSFQPYDILIPQSYDPSKKYALIIYLHGYQHEIQKYFDLVGDDNKSTLDSLSIIKVAVYGRRNRSYVGAAEEDVLTVMKKVQSKYSIDPNKIYLIGFSMGGFGTWHIGLNYPDLFAAISPVCAYSIIKGTKFRTSVSPIEYVLNAKNLPVRIYHGALDSGINVKASRKMTGRLKEMNYNYEYIEYPDIGHDYYNTAAADKDRFTWLLQYTRNLYPGIVKHRAFYL